MLQALVLLCRSVMIVFGIITVNAVDMDVFTLPREDGSLLEGYLLPPRTDGSPILMIIQDGSWDSLLTHHQELFEQAHALGIGVIGIEKPGISDYFSYRYLHNLQDRFCDYQDCLAYLPSLFPEWKGSLIFWGESEGGLLVAKLAGLTPRIQAVVLVAAGGGLTPREEIKEAWVYRLTRTGYSPEEIGAAVALLEEQMDTMLADPTQDETFCGNTYQWWASLLREGVAAEFLSKSSFPILLIHGTADDCIPILSADLANEQLTTTHPVTYLRLEGYDHYLPEKEVVQAAFLWLESVLSPCPVSQDIFLRMQFPPQAQSMEFNTLFYGRGRDRGEISVKASGEKDNQGNERAGVEVNASKVTESGVAMEGKASASTSKDREGNIKNDVKVEVSLSRGF